MKIFKNYGFIWVTGILFLFSLVGHWIFGWFAYIDEQQALNQPLEVTGYTIEMMRDTLENWQSEFLQLIWQVAGLSFLLHVGSPQSREESDRVEAKIDAILMRVSSDGKEVIKRVDDAYEGRHTDPLYDQPNLLD